MVERADINSVLLQMRSIQSQVQRPDDAVSSVGLQSLQQTNQNQMVEAPGFKDVLMDVVNGVNDSQAHAKNLATAFEKGDRTVDLPQVMIAAEKASISFQAMSEVRNRLVSAYEDVMKMSI